MGKGEILNIERNLEGKEGFTTYIVNKLYLKKGIEWNPYPKDYDLTFEGYRNNVIFLDNDGTLNRIDKLSIFENYAYDLGDVAGIKKLKIEKFYLKLADEITRKAREEGIHHLDKSKVISTEVKSDERESWFKEARKFVRELKKDGVTYSEHLEACRLAAEHTIPVSYIQNTLLELERMGFQIMILSASPLEANQLFGGNKLQILRSNIAATKFFEKGHLIDNPEILLGQYRYLQAERVLTERYNPGFQCKILVDDDARPSTCVASNLGIDLMIDVNIKKEDTLIKELLGKAYAYLPEMRNNSRKLVEFIKKYEKAKILGYFKTPELMKEIILKIRNLDNLAERVKTEENNTIVVNNFTNEYDMLMGFYRPVFPEETLHVSKHLDELKFTHDPRVRREKVEYMMDLLKKNTAEYYADDDFIRGLGVL